MVVATPLAEGLAAAPRATVRTNRHSTVTTCSYSTIATGRPYVAVAFSVFDLAVGVHRLCCLVQLRQLSKQFAGASARLFKFLNFSGRRIALLKKLGLQSNQATQFDADLCFIVVDITPNQDRTQGGSATTAWAGMPSK